MRAPHIATGSRKIVLARPNDGPIVKQASPPSRPQGVFHLPRIAADVMRARSNSVLQNMIDAA
jgi:hypothetical protein